MSARLEHVMGMPVLIDVRDERFPEAAIDEAFGWLRWVDATFSTFRADSEISRLNRGEIAEADCHPHVRSVLATCRALRERTAGAFDAEAAGRGGVDPSGYVKGWAVGKTWELLEAAGACNGIVDAGGDLVVRGRPAPGRRWRVGIQHPERDDAVAAVLELGDMAVATSGAYRRGPHIVDPRSGRPASGVRSVTCVGRDIAVADAFATAAFAMGGAGAAWVAAQPEVESMIIGDDDVVLFTPGFDAQRAPLAV